MSKQDYSSPKQWRDEAMLRENSVTTDEQSSRLSQAQNHNQLNNITDPDTLMDQQLYVLGKMDLDEYQNYLLFKHGQA